MRHAQAKREQSPGSADHPIPLRALVCESIVLSLLSSVLVHTETAGWGIHVFYDPTKSNFGAPWPLASPFTQQL